RDGIDDRAVRLDQLDLVRARSVLRDRRLRLRVRGPAGNRRIRVPRPAVAPARANRGAGRMADAPGDAHGGAVVGGLGSARAPAEWGRYANLVDADAGRDRGDESDAGVAAVRAALAPVAGDNRGPDRADPGAAVPGPRRGGVH